jgi:hypothetical protein
VSERSKSQWRGCVRRPRQDRPHRGTATCHKSLDADLAGCPQWLATAICCDSNVDVRQAPLSAVWTTRAVHNCSAGVIARVVTSAFAASIQLVLRVGDPPRERGRGAIVAG